MTKAIGLSIDESDYVFLKKNGINRSEFLRQAIKAFKEGKFLYNKEKQI